jgi:competence protein ComEA
MEQHPERTRERETSGDVIGTSAVLRGGSRKTPVARGSIGEEAKRASRWTRFRTLKESVWAPVALKALGIFAGMLALAGVGASSLARGAGVPVSAGSSVPRVAMAAGLGVLGKVEPARAAVRTASGVSADAARMAEPAVDAGPGTAAGADAGAVVPATGVTADGKVILNRASVDELCQLPGVGPKRAQAIVELRTKLGGRFKRMTDLLRLKGVGPKSLKKIEAKAVLDAP